MAKLPKIDVPTYNLVLPSGKPIKFRPMLAKEEKLFLQSKWGEDVKEMRNTVVQVANNCVLNEDFDAETAPIFDVEYLYLQLRAKSIGEILTLEFIGREDAECEGCKTIKRIDVNLSDVQSTGELGHDKKIRIADNFGFIMRYPTINESEILESAWLQNLSKKPTDNFGNRYFEAIASCIEFVYTNEEMIDTKTVDKQELLDMLDNLPREKFALVQDFFKTMPHVKHTITIHCDKCNAKEDVLLEGLENFFDLG